MKKTYSELIEYYENVSPREIIADMYFDYKEEIGNLNNLGKQLVEENKQLKGQLQQKENIIKEVREYIENNWISQKDADYYRFDDAELDIEISDIAVLFDILDKGE